MIQLDNKLTIFAYLLILIGVAMLVVAIIESTKGNQFYWAAPWIPLIGGFSILSINK